MSSVHCVWLLGVCAVSSAGRTAALPLGSHCFIIINLLPRAHWTHHWNPVFIVDLSQVAYTYCKIRTSNKFRTACKNLNTTEFQECVLLSRTHFLSRLPCGHCLTGICSFTQSQKWQVTPPSQKAFQLIEWKKDLLNINTESIVWFTYNKAAWLHFSELL